MPEKITQSLPFRFLKQFATWLLFFLITRSIFLFYNFSDLHDAGFGETLASFFYALYVDVAMCCYIMALPFLLYVVMYFWSSPLPDRINRIYNTIVVVIVSIITISELTIYDEWAHKLTFKAIWFLRNPSEVFHTASWAQLLLGISGIIFLSTVGWKLFSKILGPYYVAPERRWVHSIAFTLLTPALLVTGLRGGWRPIPIQVSDAYYSNNNFLNYVSVNSSFHLMSSIFQSRTTEPYRFMPDAEAETLFTALHTLPKDTTIAVLDTTRPNVVLVVLESWAADLVQTLGGFEGITPHTNALMKNGIVFDSCYASGNLSDQGMAAVFSAFPAQPTTSIITQPEKYNHLPCMNKEFKKAGYSTSFLFGGQLNYGNIRAYMYFNQFDRITEGSDFGSEVPQGRLGAHDEYAYARVMQNLKGVKEPFFASMFTLSTHGPFDIPMKKDKLKWGDKEQDFINSAYYADSCIGNFISAAKKEPWYNNTIFVFVADHSHNTPKNYEYFAPEYRRITFWMYGEPIKKEFRGYHYTKICSQVDVASTLLHQLHMDASTFRYSKNLFNPFAPAFAYYSYENGYGWISNKGEVVYDVNSKSHARVREAVPGAKEALTREGAAYLQVMFNQYLKY